MKKITLENRKYDLNEIYDICTHKHQISLSSQLKKEIISSRLFVKKKLEESNPIYGINTGFGKLSQIKIDNSDINKLQNNLLVSHAVGVGDNTPDAIVRIIILLKIISFTKCNSGISLDVIEALISFLNNDCLPIIPLKGSVGASGDLAPLSHMALALTGVGNVKHNGELISSKEALKKISLKPVKLGAKEGLALINGTQFSTAYGVFCLTRLQNLFKVCDLTSAMTIEGLKGSKKPFLDYVNKVKPYKGQMDTCQNIIAILENSEIMDSHKNCDRVQDMYSLRCIPQVHGSARDLLYFSIKQINTEINSVSDNPLVFESEDKIISAGQFHAEAVGHSLDIAAMAVASLSNISERRIFSLLKGDYELPDFLVDNPGLNSGFMMLQVTAAALASENKLLSNPSSTDSIPTCSDQEDYVSMAPYSARKLFDSINNFEAILSIELMCACQAVDFRKGLKPAKILNILHKLIREHIPFLDKDRLLKDDIDLLIKLINENYLLNKINKYISII